MPTEDLICLTRRADIGNAAMILHQACAFSGVTINGGVGAPPSLCFSSSGRQVTNTTAGNTAAATPLTANCSATTASTFVVDKTGSDRKLRVVVDFGGKVRMCDPAKTLSAAQPDGC